MDKLIIEFNKKFDKQKQELIDGFKALGEEKRLPKVLATIEGEQPTYKDYFKAGWQSRQAEVDALKNLLEKDNTLTTCITKMQICKRWLKRKTSGLRNFKQKLMRLSMF